MNYDLDFKCKKKSLIVFILIGFNLSAQQSNFNNIPYHLLGMWIYKSSDSSFRFEYWEIHDDRTFQGMGGKVKGSDTSCKETLWIEWQMGKLYYLANAEGQNGDKYITFACTKNRQPKCRRDIVIQQPKARFSADH